MFQLYLLTVLTNILAGLALASGFLSERFERFSDYTDFMENSTYRVVLAGASILVGIINLFSTYKGDIAVLGDLLPSLSGIITGILLVAEFISQRREGAQDKAAELAEKVGSFSSPYRTIVGVSAIIIGILHIFLVELIIL